MTAIQMNAELLRNMSIIAEDEHLLKRAAKYLRKNSSPRLSVPRNNLERVLKVLKNSTSIFVVYEPI